MRNLWKSFIRVMSEKPTDYTPYVELEELQEALVEAGDNVE